MSSAGRTVEIATLTRAREEGADKDKTVIRVLPADEVNAIIKDFNEKEEARKKAEKAKEEKAKQEKAKEEKAKQEKAAAGTSSST